MVVSGRLACSFCGGEEQDGRRVVLGPDVAICYPCAAAAIRAIDDGVISEGLAVEAGRCSFCSNEADRVVSGSAASICPSCLELCRDIVSGDQTERNRARTALQQSYADQGLVRVVYPPPGGSAKEA